MGLEFDNLNLTVEELDLLINSICDHLGCSQDRLIDTVSIRAKEFIKTSNGNLFTTPLSIVKKIVLAGTQDDKGSLIQNLIDTHDIRNDVYEGGFKTWECSKDLVTFLDKNNILASIMSPIDTTNILELGSGSSLPAIFCLKELNKCEDQNQFNVHVQDYNKEVLKYLFLPNVTLNLGLDKAQQLIRCNKIKAYYGPWSRFASSLKYDLIMMSETIYNVESYPSLHKLLINYLKLNGLVMLAAKDTYFGCTGSLFEWIDYVKNCGDFSISAITQVNSEGIPRSILTMKRV